MENPNRQMGSLGVNRTGKNIKKSPIHQPNFSHPNTGGSSRPQPQPQVYNINKNDFRSIVQQLTGSPLREQILPRPPQNSPKPQSTRLQKIKPPPLTPINHPRIPVHPSPPHQYGQPPFIPTDVWGNRAESPISAYMRYLQTSIVDPVGPTRQGNPLPSGLFPNPHLPPPGLSPRYSLLSPRITPLPFPSPQGLPFLPSPTSQFLMPSPSAGGFFNLLSPSPQSPYPLLSPPGIHQPPPLSPNFSFSSGGQTGILGPGPHPPPSPGYGFPLSPSGFFPHTSPRWRV
ncbi:unnamed protein product [Cuscuta europaea]|uniref:VQ domain-containing protein n=1 Tax=Cuscuta europaea TaxID=41803 RepID=A0A9P1A0T0_CUSEU|nr:unnamed protein product [Cuscuta europaea]